MTYEEWIKAGPSKAADEWAKMSGMTPERKRKLKAILKKLWPKEKKNDIRKIP